MLVQPINGAVHHGLCITSYGLRIHSCAPSCPPHLCLYCCRQHPYCMWCGLDCNMPPSPDCLEHMGCGADAKQITCRIEVGGNGTERVAYSGWERVCVVVWHTAAAPSRSENLSQHKTDIERAGTVCVQTQHTCTWTAVNVLSAFAPATLSLNCPTSLPCTC